VLLLCSPPAHSIKFLSRLEVFTIGSKQRETNPNKFIITLPLLASRGVRHRNLDIAQGLAVPCMAHHLHGLLRRFFKRH
jgi:hypothetical protein